MPKRPVFMECMAALMEVFGVDYSARAIQGYWSALQHLSDEEMNRVTAVAFSKSRFMPRPEELLGYCKGDLHHMAEQAWFAFRAAFVRHGASRAMFFPDSISAQAVRSMGGLCGLARGREADFLMKGKRDFIAAWKHAYEAEENRKEAERRECEANGWPPPEEKADPGRTLAGVFGTGDPIRLPGRNEPPAKRLKDRTTRPDPDEAGNVIRICGSTESRETFSRFSPR